MDSLSQKGRINREIINLYIKKQIMSTQEVIEKVIKNTFETIKKVYKSQNESKCEYIDNVGSRIIFPVYADEKTIRISEQELRFIFVEQFNKECINGDDDLYYSIETPTKNKYIFSETKDNPRKDGDGESARTDMVIHKKVDNNKFERVALIEFKALNPGKHNYLKDICKLKEEECKLKYFIQIIKTFDNGTEKNLNDKTIEMKEAKIIYRCDCLEKDEKVTIEWQK